MYPIMSSVIILKIIYIKNFLTSPLLLDNINGYKSEKDDKN